jgi:hypothetical protein
MNDGQQHLLGRFDLAAPVRVHLDPSLQLKRRYALLVVQCAGIDKSGKFSNLTCRFV